MGYFWFSVATAKRLPKVGDHWHADYEVIICGNKMPILPYTQGNIHTHGDGKIHIHPQYPYEAGENANLGRFFRSASVTFTDSTIQYPGNRAYTNGDLCSNGKPGKLKLFVNGKEDDKLDKYVPEDLDRIRVEFTTE